MPLGQRPSGRSRCRNQPYRTPADHVNDQSQTNQINAKAGIRPVRVDAEVFALIQRSLRLSELTQGAFDITYGSIDKQLWNFDTTMTRLPDPKTARHLVRLINYRNVQLDAEARTVFLKEARDAHWVWRHWQRLCGRTGQTHSAANGVCSTALSMQPAT